MSKVSLLPPGSTPLMHALAAIGGDAIDSIPINLRSTWDPATCPLPLLPYLAIAFSVDRWNPAWPEVTQRAIIAASWEIHRHKGTVGSLRRVLESFRYAVEITEWWQSDPPGPRGTFEITVNVLDSGISNALYTEIERLINDVKPLARHLANLVIELAPMSDMYFAAAVGEIDTLTVYPGD